MRTEKRKDRKAGGSRDVYVYLFAIFNEYRMIAEAEIKVLQGRNETRCGNQILIVGRQNLTRTASELATELKKGETSDNLQASRGLVKEMMAAKQSAGRARKSSVSGWNR
ncbi:hypothetical protein SLA2020_156630 [Shorea laevis]